MAITGGDLKKIKEVFELVFVEKVEELGLVTKEDIKHLPTKEEFYAKEDELMKELKDAREEQSGLSQHDRDQFDAIEALQKIHPHNSHSTFA
jgi:polysaccharide pyruvyl transferase WcaK-like protein